METTITEAKNTLTALVHQVESGEIVHLTRHGRPVAVLLSEADYRRLLEEVAPATDLLDFVRSWRAGLPWGWEGFGDQETDAWRDRSPGKPFRWEN